MEHHLSQLSHCVAQIHVHILRKTIEGYENYSDFVTFENIFLTKVYLYLIDLSLLKCEMEFMGHWL